MDSANFPQGALFALISVTACQSGSDVDTGEGAGDTSTDPGPGVPERFDVAAVDDFPGGDGDCEGGGGGEVEFSYIWIANSPEGNVSKIDTRTLEQRGRGVLRRSHAWPALCPPGSR